MYGNINTGDVLASLYQNNPTFRSFAENTMQGMASQAKAQQLQGLLAKIGQPGGLDQVLSAMNGQPSTASSAATAQEAAGGMPVAQAAAAPTQGGTSVQNPVYQEAMRVVEEFRSMMQTINSNLGEIHKMMEAQGKNLADMERRINRASASDE